MHLIKQNIKNNSTEKFITIKDHFKIERFTMVDIVQMFYSNDQTQLQHWNSYNKRINLLNKHLHHSDSNSWWSMCIHRTCQKGVILQLNNVLFLEICMPGEFLNNIKIQTRDKQAIKLLARIVHRLALKLPSNWMHRNYVLS